METTQKEQKKANQLWRTWPRGGGSKDTTREQGGGVGGHRREHILMESSSRDDVDERRLASILQANQGELHFLLKEQPAREERRKEEARGSAADEGRLLRGERAHPLKKSRRLFI